MCSSDLIQINGGFPLGLDNLIGVTAPQTSDLVVESDTGAVTEAGAAGDGNAAADGNVLTNDSDPDGDSLVVSKVNGNAGNVGVAVEGKYGSVEIDANGVWHYALNNDDKDTNSLRAGETATDVFTYTVSDGHGETGTARVTVTITGANDAASVDRKSTRLNSSH